jgi:hypothetical protein
VRPFAFSQTGKVVVDFAHHLAQGEAEEVKGFTPNAANRMRK